MSLTRRELLNLGLAASALLSLPQAAEARRFVNRTGLRANQFVWEPSQPDAGPVSLIVSLQDRLVHVYKGNVLVGISTCDVGRKGSPMPTGIFTVGGGRQADGDADAGTLAWTGSAVHADDVAQFPASLGCVRVPTVFARLLDDVIRPGTMVILAKQRTEPMDVVHSGPFPLVPVYEAMDRLVQPVAQRPMANRRLGNAQDGHVAIIMSRASRIAILFRDGVREQVARVEFTQPNSHIGTHVYSLTGTAPNGHDLVWLGFGVGASSRENHLVDWHGDALLDQIAFEDRASAVAMARMLHVGSTLIVTDAPSTASNHETPADFVLVSTQGSNAELKRGRARRRPRRRIIRRRRRTWADEFLSSLR